MPTRQVAGCLGLHTAWWVVGRLHASGRGQVVGRACFPGSSLPAVYRQEGGRAGRV